MKPQAGSTGGGSTRKPRTPRQQSAAYRDWNKNARKPAPYGRYEDKSPKERWKSAKRSVGKRKAR